MTYDEFVLKNVLSFNELSKILSNASLELQLEAVKKDGYSIQFIKKPSCELQLEAIKKNSYSIQFIKKPSYEVQMEAVKKNSFSIQFIEKPSYEVRKYCLDKYNNCELHKDVVLENICKVCKKVKICTSKIDKDLYESCPYFLEHIALKNS